MLKLYDSAFASRKNEAFVGVVAKDAQGNKNVYVLKVDDIEQLRIQVNAIWNDQKYAKYLTDKERIDAIHETLAKEFAKSNGQIEKKFLELFPNAGFSIYKADNEISNFSKLTLNNGSVLSNPCI